MLLAIENSECNMFLGCNLFPNVSETQLANSIHVLIFLDYEIHPNLKTQIQPTCKVAVRPRLDNKDWKSSSVQDWQHLKKFKARGSEKIDWGSSQFVGCQIEHLSLVGSWDCTHRLSACNSLETALWVGRKYGWNGSWAGRKVRVLRRLCWQFDLFRFLLRLLQEFYDFTPQGLLHRLVHILKGLMFFVDAFFDGIRICLDWSSGLCQVKSFHWNCCEGVIGQGLTREAWYTMVYSRCYATALWILQYCKKSICEIHTDPPAFSASTWHCWVKSFRVWWLGTQGIETSNQNIYFLEFRRANQSTETALKLHWIDPKTAPATKSISRLQRLVACYI